MLNVLGALQDMPGEKTCWVRVPLDARLLEAVGAVRGCEAVGSCGRQWEAPAAVGCRRGSWRVWWGCTWFTCLSTSCDVPAFRSRRRDLWHLSDFPRPLVRSGVCACPCMNMEMAGGASSRVSGLINDLRLCCVVAHQHGDSAELHYERQCESPPLT